MATLPILYSFRRCPYAMRARLALAYGRVQCEIREILLRDKPPSMLEISPKGTVPVLFFPHENRVIDESLDIMKWALSQKDPEGWSTLEEASKGLITENDTTFKRALDEYKYPNRFEEGDSLRARGEAEIFIKKLEARLEKHSYLCGEKKSLADIGIFPFVRQFSKVDPDWFEAASYPRLGSWLGELLESDLFASVMHKYPVWKNGDDPTFFPPH